MNTAALLALAISASPLAVTAAANATATTGGVATPHETGNTTAIQPLGLEEWFCTAPEGSVEKFWRLTKNEGPYYYTIYPLHKEWTMLASYRDGGIQNVHWKYTDDPNDKECMKDWNYHAADGRTLKTRVVGRTTTHGQNRRWCGLPVYNDGGVEGYQWAYCFCGWSYPGFP